LNPKKVFDLKRRIPLDALFALKTFVLSLAPPDTVRAASTPVRRSSRATKMLREDGRAGVVS
jgi:hypothetical protein